MAEGVNAEAKELYKLIGNYDATTKNIYHELKEIKDSVAEIQKCMADIDQTAKNNVHRIEIIEKYGVPKATNMKIDSSLLLVALNWIKDILQMMGVF